MKNPGSWFGSQFSAELTSMYRMAEGESRLSEVAVHEIRKSCKRLRAIFRLAASSFGSKFQKRENKRFKKVSKSLAGLRDQAVQYELYKSLLSEILPESNLERSDDENIKKWSRQCFSDEGKNMGLAKDVRKVAYEEALFARNFPLNEISFRKLCSCLATQEKKTCKAKKKAIAKTTPERLHRWRKEAKYLYYQKQKMDQGGYLQNMKKDLEKMKSLTDCLGDLHDLDVLCESAASFSGDLPYVDQVIPFALVKREGMAEKLRRWG